MAGIGLNLLHFAGKYQDNDKRQSALRVVDQMVSRMEQMEMGRTDPRYISTPDYPAGLMQGFSGPALFLVRAYEDTGDTALLDLAERAIRRDLRYCTISGDTLQVDEGWRLMPYLDGGSMGIAIALSAFLEHREITEFRATMSTIRLAAVPQFVIHAGLLHGRCSMIFALTHLERPQQVNDWSRPLAGHMRRLAWHAVAYQGEIAFPGDFLRRLSMDLATGAAGVLLAIGAACGEPDSDLPFHSRRGPAETTTTSEGGESR
jgi:hypothetical protein